MGALRPVWVSGMLSGFFQSVQGWSYLYQGRHVRVGQGSGFRGQGLGVRV